MRDVVPLVQATFDGFVATRYDGAASEGDLTKLRLIDSYELVARPVTLADGVWLFPELAEPARSRTVEMRPLPSGAVLHMFTPQPSQAGEKR